MRTILTDIPGIGPCRARKLLKKFGSVARIREATVADIAVVDGINEQIASSVQHYLRAVG